MRVLASLLLALVVALATAAPADATQRACSRSGDECHGWSKRGGIVRLTMDTFALRGRITICVVTPEERTTCKRFTLRRAKGGVYRIRARWTRHFPRGGPGVYTAVFRYAGRQVGDPVTTRLG